MLTAQVRGCYFCGGDHEIGLAPTEACPKARIKRAAKPDRAVEAVFVSAIHRLPKDDVEFAHCMADHMLCGILRQLGYDAVVDAFEAVGKTYT